MLELLIINNFDNENKLIINIYYLRKIYPKKNSYNYFLIYYIIIYQNYSITLLTNFCFSNKLNFI